MLRIISFAAVCLAMPATAEAQARPFAIDGSGRSFASLQEAVDAIGSGSGTIRIAPGTYRQCAVQGAGQVAYVAAQPGTVRFEGTSCEGKAALVLRGRSARVQGLSFVNIRVPDRNGAGIRIEQGDLDVSETLFRDGENGILSSNDGKGTIRISRSTFSGLGGCPDGMCAHSLYIGDYGSLIVDRVRFEKGRGGHYAKSRAARVEIVNSSFDDSGGKATNYMIDLSNGASGRITGNRFVQGKDKENHSAFIMIAAEGKANSSNGLVIADNDASLAPGVTWPSVFVADASGDRLAIGANRLGPRLGRFEKR